MREKDRKRGGDQGREVENEAETQRKQEREGWMI